MIVPGLTFGAGGRTAATIGLGTVANFLNQGFGFMNNGNLALDTNPVSGAVGNSGFAQNASGAIFATVTPSGSDVYIDGVRVSITGQLVIESADAASFSSGNPITAAGNFSVN